MKARLILLAAFVLTACQTDGPRDSGGTLMSYSEWQDISTKDADFNIAEHLPAGILSRAEKRTRDNALSHNRFVLSGPGGTGSITTEYVPIGFYSMRVKDQIKSETGFAEDIEKNFGKPQEIFPIYWRNNLSGYGAVVTASGNRLCYVARTGYKFNTGSYDNDFGQFDTTVSAFYCGTKVEKEDFAAVFANIAKNRR